MHTQEVLPLCTAAAMHELDEAAQPAHVCRVCLDPLQFAPGPHEAVFLRCRCSGGKEAMHLSCAEQWFAGARCSEICEVCCSPAYGLPLTIKTAIREHQARRDEDDDTGTDHQESSPSYELALEQLISAASRLVARLLGRGPQQPTTPRQHVQSHQTLPSYLSGYAVFCLLPSMLSSLAIIFFCFRVMDAGIVVTVIMAVGISSLTILHWMWRPTRTCLHLVFVMNLLGCILGMCVLFRAAISSWSGSQQVGLGCSVGLLMSLAVQHLLLEPCLACCSWRPAAVPPLNMRSLPREAAEPMGIL